MKNTFRYFAVVYFYLTSSWDSGWRKPSNMDPGREESCLKRMEAEKLSSTCNTERPQLSEAKIHCTHKERHISEPPGQTFSNQNMTKKNTLILAWKPLHLQFPTLLPAPYTKPVIRWNQWKQHTQTIQTSKNVPPLQRTNWICVGYLQYLNIFHWVPCYCYIGSTLSSLQILCRKANRTTHSTHHDHTHIFLYFRQIYATSNNVSNRDYSEINNPRYAIGKIQKVLGRMVKWM